MTRLTYRDAAGAVHEVVVRQTSTGDWEALDTCADEELVIECLDGRVDGEPQAEAVAGDYVTSGRFMPLAGQQCQRVTGALARQLLVEPIDAGGRGAVAHDVLTASISR